MERVITETAKDRHPTILAVRGYNLIKSDGEMRLGEAFEARSKQVAARELKANKHRYFVRGPSPDRPWIPVYAVNGDTGSYLRTTPDNTEADNLIELPDFSWPLPESRAEPSRPS